MNKIWLSLVLVVALVAGFSCSKKEEAPATGTETVAAPDAAAQGETAEKITYLLNVVVEPEGAGTVTPANGAFDKGSTLELNATANAGFTFDRWEGDVVGSTNMVQVVLDTNKNVKAIFKAAEAEAPAPGAPATGSGN